MATASNAAPSIVTNPPRLTPPAISLVTSANTITFSAAPEGEGDERWGAGFAYSPVGCGDGGLDTICPTPDFVKEACANPELVEVQPFYVYAADKCSTFSFRERDYFDRAAQKLAAVESYFIEQEFMSDTLSLGNPHVIDPSVEIVTDGPTSPATALAALEDGLANCMRGNRAMIHVRPGMLILLEASHVIRREGNVWLTAMDNIVVPGRGYPGSAPDGSPATPTSQWMYATSMVTVLRDTVQLLPRPVERTDDNPMGIPQSAVTRSTNDITVVAERIVAVTFDPSCCVLAAESLRSV